MNAHVAWSLTIFFSFLPMLLAFSLVFRGMKGTSRSIGLFGFVVCIIDLAFLAALLSGHTAPLGSILEWASVFSFLTWIAFISMDVLARSRAASRAAAPLKNEANVALESQRQSQIGVLAGIVLITMLIIATQAIPRFQEMGPYHVPPETGDGWTTASLQEVGMDQEPINEMLTMLAQQKAYKIHSLLIVKDGKLVLEKYYPGDDITVTGNLSFTRKNFDRDTLHCLASATKSVTSILVGMAIDQGKISDVDEKMFVSFPEYADLIRDGKGEITLQQMLTMTSGIPWDESYPYTDERNDITHMLFFSPEPIRFVLEKRLTGKPGEAWVYNSGTTNLLGEIVHRRTGTPLAEYAKDNLFQPLGITSFKWLTFRSSPDMAVASSLLYLKPRDMAKIGQFYLQEGSWNGKQLVSHHWVQESTANSVVFQEPAIDFGPAFQNIGYGYQWWRGNFINGDTDAIFAAGFGSQFIFIMPKINTVVVTTGLDNDYSKTFDMINRYVLGSIYNDF